MNIEEKWKEVLDDLVNQVTAISYDMFIKKLIPIEIKDGKLYLKASNSMTKQIVNNSYSFLISEALEQHFGLDEYEILDPVEYDEYIKVYEDKLKAQEKKPNPFNPKYTFENFVVGKSNQFVYSAVRSVAESPGTRFNPLFIHGGVGLGKTHLLHAIGNYILEHSPNLKVLYVTCENFMNDYIKTLQDPTKNIGAFREKYRNVDVLMVDDIQFIKAKKATQEEFFHTFNDLYQNNKQIIISSDRPPKEISTLEERLVSRFSMGLIQDIQQPDFETRYVILQKKAQMENIIIEPEAMAFIAENVTTNIRELEGVLTKTSFLTQLLGRSKSTVDDARETLNNVVIEDKSRLTVERIINEVCSYYGVSKEAVMGTRRNKEIAEARHICIYLIFDLLNMPLTTIGKEIFKLDHTTIMYARNKIADSIGVNTRITQDVNNIKQKLQ